MNWKIGLSLALGPLAALMLVIWFFLRPAWKETQRLEDDAYWALKISTAQVKADTVWLPDTGKSRTFSGIAQGSPTKPETTYIPIDTTSWKTIVDCRRDFAVLQAKYSDISTPFEATIPFDSGSSLSVRAHPLSRSIEWKIQQKPVIRDGMVITLTKTVMGRCEEQNWSVSAYSLWQYGPGAGVDLGFKPIVLGYAVQAGEKPTLKFGVYSTF